MDPNLGYKPIKKVHKENLPKHAEVVGYLVHRIQTNCNQSYDHAYHLYGDTLRKHWIDRNIYPISSKRVKREVKVFLDNF